ncbi:MAG: hypothetical protein CL608_30445 [Anaerolineaceae bacterium]|nr:hypothetical protein [Anaerolineaceae bacterium]
MSGRAWHFYFQSQDVLTNLQIPPPRRREFANCLRSTLTPPCEFSAANKGSLWVRLIKVEAKMSAIQEVAVQKKVEQKIEEYNKRFFTPSKATIRRWQAQAKQALDRKNQLALPLVFHNISH